MTTAERNKHLRELANDIAKQAAQVIGLSYVPKCRRITRRRGYGGPEGFSVPDWCAKNTDYFVYYVAHEVCHAKVHSHGPEFHAAERAVLRHFGMVPQYAHGGKGPYVYALRDAVYGGIRVVAETVGACRKEHAE